MSKLVKEAAAPQDVLRWILGAALVGGAARGGLGLYHQMAGRDNPIKPISDLYDPSVDVPIKMTPEQYKKYQELKAGRPDAGKRPAPKLAYDKTASPWDNTVKAMSVVGGGALGWHLASKLLRRHKERKLNSQLEQARKELNDLVMSHPGSGHDHKIAAAFDFLDLAASQYVDQKTKTAAFNFDALSKGVGGAAKRNPMAAVGLGGVGALLGGSALPGADRLVSGVGSGVASGAAGLGKLVAGPLGYAAAATLGPIAALSLLYGTYKGYSAAASGNKRQVDLEALRKKIREREAAVTPYFELKPTVAHKTPEPVKPKGQQMGLTRPFTDVDAKRDEEAKTASLLAYLNRAI